MAEKYKKWGFVGCGNLAQAIISGAIENKSLRASDISATNRSAKKLSAFSKKWRIKKHRTNLELARASDILVLGTKPQDLGVAIAEISADVGTFPVIVSLAAGVRTSSLRKSFPQALAVVRVMASLPVKVKAGVFGVAFDFRGCSHREKTQIKKSILKVFSSLGLVVELKTDDSLDIITAGGASGVGFVFEIMRIFELWFKSQGYSAQIARQIAVQTFLGTAILALQNPDVSLEKWREAVTSKKGTTLAGLQHLKSRQLERILKGALTSSKNRARELSKIFSDTVF